MENPRPPCPYSPRSTASTAPGAPLLEAYPSLGSGALFLQMNKGGTYPVPDGDIRTKWSSLGSGTVLVDSDWAVEPGKERLVLKKDSAPPRSHLFFLLPQPSASHLLNGCSLVSTWSSSPKHGLQNRTDGDKWGERSHRSFSADHPQIYQQL